MSVPFVGGNPVCRHAVLRWQHPFAGLQADAMAAFQVFQYFLGGLPPLGDNFGKLFE